MTKHGDEDLAVALQNARVALAARQRIEEELRRAKAELEEQHRDLELLNRTAALLGANLDLESVVQAVTDAGTQLTGAEFGAFFYNVLNEAGESYMLYTLSGVDRSAFERFPMPRNTAVLRRPSRARASCAPTISSSMTATAKATRIAGCPKGTCRSGAISRSLSRRARAR